MAVATGVINLRLDPKSAMTGAALGSPVGWLIWPFSADRFLARLQWLEQRFNRSLHAPAAWWR
jgi:hypothetical protein